MSRSFETNPKGWGEKAQGELKSWLREFVDEKRAVSLLASPRGVLIAPSFEPDAVADAGRSPRIACVRLSRFRAPSNDYYVIIENIVGEAVKRTRRFFSWAQIGLTPEDWVSFTGKDPQSLRARPDPAGLNRRDRKDVILDDACARALLIRRQKVIDYARKRLPSEEGRVTRMLDQLAANTSFPLALSYATELAFFDREIPGSGYYSYPGQYWRVERTGKTIGEIEAAAPDPSQEADS